MPQFIMHTTPVLRQSEKLPGRMTPESLTYLRGGLGREGRLYHCLIPQQTVEFGQYEF